MRARALTLPLDVPLRLKPEAANVYALAPAGALAYARKRKYEEGFPMVYIEWDKDHWTYEGELDKWTFETHFELVTEEGKAVGLPPELQQGIEKLFADYVATTEANIAGEQEQPVKPPDSQLYDLDTPEDYASLAKKASEMATQGNAFILLGIQEAESEGEKVLIPFLLQSYRDEVAGLFLETQLGEYVAQAFRNSAVELIRQIRREEIPPDPGA